MTEHEKRIREALEAGPTEGVWNWDCDPVKGDPLGRTRYRVTTVGKTITQVYYSSYEGGPTNAEQDAAFIAACNPAAIRALLADLDAVRVALLKIARMAEDLKKPCSMDADSPQAIRNGQYMNICYAAHAALKGATA